MGVFQFVPRTRCLRSWCMTVLVSVCAWAVNAQATPAAAQDAVASIFHEKVVVEKKHDEEEESEHAKDRESHESKSAREETEEREKDDKEDRIFAEFTKIIKADYPELYKEWQKLVAINRGEAKEMFEDAGIQFMQILQERGRKNFDLKCKSLELRLKVRDAARRLKKLTPGDEKEKLQQKIEADLGDLFEVMLALRKQEIEYLNVELETLKETTRQVEQDKARHVKNYLEELLGGQDKPFDW